MNRDYEPIGKDGGKSGLTRNVLILMLIAFVGGGIAAGWVLSRYNPFATEEAAVEEVTESPAAALAKAVKE